MATFEGACHCGAVTVAFTTMLEPRKLEVRACACAFCRRHGARTVSDPDGGLTVAAEPGAARFYRFGLEITDFVVCASCGNYVAALMTDPDGGRFGIVNLSMLAAAERFSTPAAPRDYGAEDGAGRRPAAGHVDPGRGRAVSLTAGWAPLT